MHARLWYPLVLLWLGVSQASILMAQSQVSLISTGAVWKYLDNGSDPGAAWTGLAFNDSVWASGPAQLGYGDGDEATVLNYGGVPGNKYITTYFRRTFILTNASVFSNLFLRVLRDDGVIVHLNGAEVYRNNLPSIVTNRTLANVAIDAADESTFLEGVISTAPLQSGSNVLAVEIHQVATNSSDISFALELIGNYTPPPPDLGTNDVSDLGPAPLLEFRFNETGTNAPSTGLDTTTLDLKTSATNFADLHSLDSAGVSGRPGDRSFDNTASTGMGSSHSGGMALQASPIESIGRLASLTLQGWFKCESGPLNDNIPRLIDTSPRDRIVLIGEDPGGFNFAFKQTSVHSFSAYAEVGQWVYFALSYDSTVSSDNVKFYKGTRTSAVTLVNTRTLNQGVGAEGLGLRVGNTTVSTFGDRPFDGWLDNIRIFGSKTDASGVLDLIQLERLRLRDLLNAPDVARLTVTRSNSTAVLQWPTYPGGFVLEATDSLLALPSWSTNALAVTKTNNQNTVTVPATGIKYFRLRR